MKSKTAICLISALTFSAFSCSAYANFLDKSWVYHGPAGDQTFEKCGGGLGSPLVSLEDIQKKYELKRFGKSDFTLQHIASRREVRFSLRHKKVLSEKWNAELSETPQLIKKKLCVPLDFGDRVLTPLLTGESPKAWDDHLQYTSFAQIVLDPGHGGNDWGTLGLYKGEALKEKDLTLEFSKEFESALREKNISVALTRNQDNFVALTERYALANKLNSKLFLSLHLNSSNISPGFEIFTLSLFKRDRKALEEIGSKVSEGKETALLTFKSAAKQERSIEWASKFKKIMSEYIKPVNAGMRREPFFLLYAVESPGLLLELGSMDREEDLHFWLNKKLRLSLWKKLATEIATELQLKPVSK